MTRQVRPPSSRKEKIEFVRQVDEMKAQGIKIQDACVQLGRTKWTYANWRGLVHSPKWKRKQKEDLVVSRKYKKKDPQVVDIPILPLSGNTQRVMLIVGNATEITQVIRSLES